MNKFTYLVKDYLLKNNLKQKDICEKLNVSSGRLSELLRQDNISLNKMLEIAEALNCDLEIKLVPKK